jgi:hypothetical protein
MHIDGDQAGEIHQPNATSRPTGYLTDAARPPGIAIRRIAATNHAHTRLDLGAGTSRELGRLRRTRMVVLFGVVPMVTGVGLSGSGRAKMPAGPVCQIKARVLAMRVRWAS